MSLESEPGIEGFLFSFHRRIAEIGFCIYSSFVTVSCISSHLSDDYPVAFSRGAALVLYANFMTAGVFTVFNYFHIRREVE